jgi:hypothetical protein
MVLYLEPLTSSLLLLLDTTSGREEQEMLERLEMLECFLEWRICCACATMSLQQRGRHISNYKASKFEMFF